MRDSLAPSVCQAVRLSEPLRWSLSSPLVRVILSLDDLNFSSLLLHFIDSNSIEN